MLITSFTNHYQKTANGFKFGISNDIGHIHEDDVPKPIKDVLINFKDFDFKFQFRTGVQFNFILLTGLAFTYNIAIKEPIKVKALGKVLLSLSTTAVLAICASFCMFFICNVEKLVNRIYKNTETDPKALQRGVIKFANNEALINATKFFVPLSSIILLSPFITLKYISMHGLKCIASCVIPLEMQDAAVFVVLSLITIDISNQFSQKKSTDIPGIVGFIAFAICAFAMQFTKSYSSKYAMFGLKALPIFLGSLEAYYNNITRARIASAVYYNSITRIHTYNEGPNVQAKSFSTEDALSCILKSSILTAGFVGGNYLTQKVCSSIILDRFKVISSVLKVSAEFLLTPMIVISSIMLLDILCSNANNTPDGAALL